MVHTAGNLWEATIRKRLPVERLAEAVTADLVIVGGGYTGCSTALHARKLGLDACLVEAETIGHGGSGRNAGLVNAGLWTPPSDVEDLIGPVPGMILNRLLAGAPDLVFSLVDEYEIDCDAVRNGTLHCAHSQSGLRELQRRFKQLADHDAPVSLLEADETAIRTGSPAFQGSLFDPRAGILQPLAYCNGIALSAANEGARIFQQSPVTNIGRESGRWRVSTEAGSVTAPLLLVATNAYHRPGTGVTAPEATIVSFFQFATPPLNPERLKAVIPGGEGCWDTAMVMTSFRLDAEGRLIIGAMGSLDHSASGIHAKWAEKKLRRLFPYLKTEPFEFGWSGRIAMTRDHLPKILDLAGAGYGAFGYSGRGIGPGTAFGKALAEALASGREDALPVVPAVAYHEDNRALRQAWFEAGTLVVHAMDHMMPGRRSKSR